MPAQQGARYSAKPPIDRPSAPIRDNRVYDSDLESDSKHDRLGRKHGEGKPESYSGDSKPSPVETPDYVQKPSPTLEQIREETKDANKIKEQSEASPQVKPADSYSKDETRDQVKRLFSRVRSEIESEKRGEPTGTPPAYKGKPLTPLDEMVWGPQSKGSSSKEASYSKEQEVIDAEVVEGEEKEKVNRLLDNMGLPYGEKERTDAGPGKGYKQEGGANNTSQPGDVNRIIGNYDKLIEDNPGNRARLEGERNRLVTEYLENRGDEEQIERLVAAKGGARNTAEMHSSRTGEVHSVYSDLFNKTTDPAERERLQKDRERLVTAGLEDREDARDIEKLIQLKQEMKKQQPKP